MSLRAKQVIITIILFITYLFLPIKYVGEREIMWKHEISVSKDFLYHHQDYWDMGNVVFLSLVGQFFLILSLLIQNRIITRIGIFILLFATIVRFFPSFGVSYMYELPVWAGYILSSILLYKLTKKVSLAPSQGNF